MTETKILESSAKIPETKNETNTREVKTDGKNDNKSFKHLVKHCIKEKSEMQVYVGRHRPLIIPLTFPGGHGRYGNDFKIPKDGDRQTVIEKYRKFIFSDDPRAEKLRAEFKEKLKGKTLGCWCNPDSCHAEIIAIIANT